MTDLHGSPTIESWVNVGRHVLSSGSGRDETVCGHSNCCARVSRSSHGSRQKFGWLRSGSSPDIEERTMSGRDERRIKAKLQRTRSGAKRALNGLRFISKAAGASDAEELRRLVESTFESLSEDGLLAREDFGECIGMVDSKEFAVGIFDALARRRGQKIGKITKEELGEFWLQISDQSFDARLQIFFDMYVRFWLLLFLFGYRRLTSQR
ncbi:hypothetical protein KPL71_027045 [Citrus sinensis]|uniref:Uncharacterized protein n=1 Tax=Citrus sinensis TaxID=2711 RepID=A0ACB8I3P3_CITSI|nr:hypothetical protein KPL71_027045 [Citrus sinensis]